jgi:hypothetical protein
MVEIRGLLLMVLCVQRVVGPVRTQVRAKMWVLVPGPGAASCLSVASVLVHTIYQPNKSEKEGHTFMEYSPELLCSSTNIGILTIVYYTIMHDPFHVVCEVLPGGILPTCQFRSSSFQVHGLLDNSEVAVYQLHFVLSA